jgi:translin
MTSIKVLLVEDDERLAQLTARYLESHGVLVTIDYPDAMTGGLRRTTDAVRGILEKTRGDLTLSVQQRRLEQRLQEFSERLPE